ncbi:MAG: glycogen synthase [Acidobacteriota bacterium]
MSALKLCLLSAEMVPYAKTGGLADVTAGLSRFLAAEGHDVRVFLPFYDVIKSAGRDFTPVSFLTDVPVTLGGRTFRYTVRTDSAGEGDAGRYFIDCPALFHRGGIYTGGLDDALRFAVLTRATIEACQRMGFAPDVFHCSDWHTALLPLYLRVHYGWDRLFANSRTLLTIHNLGYQGVVSTQHLNALDLAGCADMLYQEDLEAGRLSFLKTGFLYADFLSTVSRTYAREIQTPDFGFGLDGVLRARWDHLVGIVNGVDYGDWNPAEDPHLPAAYSVDDLSGKERCKQYLLESLGLDYDPKVPVFGMVTRLTPQKGLDLLPGPVSELLGAHDVRLVMLGSGEPRYEAMLADFQRRFPKKACFFRGYSEPLAHLVEAGSDFFLMPSRYEPCGLNQMYSLRYGTVPIVRKTGGLADTVQLFDRQQGEGTGIVFDHFDADALRWALLFALDLWRQPEALEQARRNAMNQDYSWQSQGPQYVELYRRLVG